MPTVTEDAKPRVKSPVELITTATLAATKLSKLGAEVCHSCQSNDLLVTTYPFSKSPRFARLLLVSCPHCGLAWVPSVNFSLDTYYNDDYARSVQPYRFYEGDFFGKENPFWRLPISKRQTQRSDRHIALVTRHAPNPDSVLDFGAGIGITLNRFPASQKFACELDPNAQRILRQQGVGLIDYMSLERQFDVVITSHTLEHFLIGDVDTALSWFWSILKPGGILMIEVPNGYKAIFDLMNDRGVHLVHEPHTIFYSSNSLARILVKARFEILQLGLDEWTQALYQGDYTTSPFRNAVVGAGLEKPIVVARKPN